MAREPTTFERKSPSSRRVSRKAAGLFTYGLICGEARPFAAFTFTRSKADYAFHSQAVSAFVACSAAASSITVTTNVAVWRHRLGCSIQGDFDRSSRLLLVKSFHEKAG